MSTATATEKKTATCSCGTSFEYLPAYRTVRGEQREILKPTHCDPCLRDLEAEEEREQQRHRAAEARRRFEERVRRSGLPPTRLRIPYPDTAPAAVRAWGAGEIRGLVLTGPYGVGKSHHAAAATWQRLHREAVRWVPVARLLTQLRAGFGDSDSASARAVIAGTGAIVLDDLDKVNPTEYGREVIYCAVDGRIEAGSPIVVTTNLSLNQLGQRLGEAVSSRLAGYCEIVQIEGPDRRVN